MTCAVFHHLPRVLLAVLVLTTLAASPSVEAQSLTLGQVSERLERAHRDVEDIQAKADFNFRLVLGFIPYNDSLHGAYYFRKPDQHRFDFPDAPSYLKDLPSMFSWKLPSVNKNDCQVTGPLEHGSERVYRLAFTPKNADSKLASITVLVNTQTWTVTQQDTLYRDGGSLLLNFVHTGEPGRRLLEKVSGKLDIRNFKLKGTATITLSEQKLNQGIDDAVFDRS